MFLTLLLSSALAVATPTPDPDGFCGVWPFETGKWDPLLKVCVAHDAAYDKEINGQPNDGYWKTTEDFITSGYQVAKTNLLAAVELPLYSILIVGIGGPLWILHKLNRTDDN